MCLFLQCPACGPGGGGRCVGPATCCGWDFGCLMGSKESEVCREEMSDPVPCRVEGKSCGRLRIAGGTCVALHLCCNEGTCLV